MAIYEFSGQIRSDMVQITHVILHLLDNMILFIYEHVANFQKISKYLGIHQKT